MTNYADKIDFDILGMVASMIEKLQTTAELNPESSDVQKDFMLCVQGMKIASDKFLEA